MRQLTQRLLDGEMQVIEVPVPSVLKGMVLVRNAYSVISPGTEGSKVRAARRSVIGKIRERPQQARQLMDLLRQAGPTKAYRTAMKKLASYSSLGYSTSGVVADMGAAVSGLSIGDKVACAGGTACHAEFVLVPQRLCVPLHAEADLQSAAYNTLGAIALQGVRQANLTVGEVAAVIGLGLVGQLTCLLLKAAGNKVIGIDIDQEMVKFAAANAADFAALRGEPGLSQRIEAFTHGLGVDCVIITAASHSTDPINFAGQIMRRKGRVIIVGDVPTGFDRDPHYYHKELELRMSCSYGPGRYDPTYEEKGIDYPAEYVRWTERRNMELFQDLVHSGRVGLKYLTTHVFPLRDADRAYELITARTEPHLGVVLEYGAPSPPSTRVQLRPSSPRPDRLGIAFIGAGNYAMSHLLPNLPDAAWLKRIAVMTPTGLTARSVSEKFRFDFCTSFEDDIFDNGAIDTVFVATRHDSHARLVERSLLAGKNVFVEKPLCITEDELASIEAVYSSEQERERLLMVGFNRRFSPLTRFIKGALGNGAMAMMYRVNAGALPRDSWIADPDVGGGRIVGEACHFIDLLTFLNGSLPKSVQAFSLGRAEGASETVTINLEFTNGSIGSICYFCNGSKSVPKEYLEIHKDGSVAMLHDFKKAEIRSDNKTATKTLLFQDKGQSEMVRSFLTALKGGRECPIAFHEIQAVSYATLKVMDALHSRAVVML